MRTSTRNDKGTMRLLVGVALALILVAALGSTALAADETPVEQLEYHAIDGGIMIDKYLGEDEASIVVPSMIDGEPVVAIGEYAFAQRETAEDGYVYTAIRLDIESVTLPDGVREIGTGAFDSLLMLKQVEMPDSLMLIGDEAFASCESLASFHWPASLSRLGEGCFANCALETLDFPGTVETIPADAFAQNYSLTDVSIPGSVREIQSGAFGGCPQLKHITLAEGTRNIGVAAFAGADIEQIRLPNGISEISAGLFLRCASLRDVTIPESVRSISQNAFWECASLASIEFGGTRAQWNTIVIDETGNEELLALTPHCTSSSEEVVLPGDIRLKPDAGLQLDDGDGTYMLMGCSLGSGEDRPAGSLPGAFTHPEGTTVEVRAGSGANVEAASPAATGDELVFYDRRVFVCSVTVVVRGDVLGTGRMSLSQVVRLARAYTGDAPLEGPYLAAGDFDGNGMIALSDLVQEVRLLHP